MTKLTTVALAALALACGGGPRLPSSPRGEAVIEVRGTIEGAPIALGAEDLAALPKATVRGRDPATGREAAFEGASLAALVQRVRPAKRTLPDTMVVRTRDGAAVPVPLTMVRQWKPVLARGEGAPPLVAWPNLEQRGLDNDPRAAGWWARDVVALELVPWPQAFGAALSAPIGASAPARIGAGLYASRCVACHKLRGAGGTVGPELTLTGAKLDAPGLDAAMKRHDLARRGLTVPDDTQRAQLLAFLQAVARAPQPEPVPPTKDPRRPGNDDDDDDLDPDAPRAPSAPGTGY